MQTPSDLYQPSARSLPRRIDPLGYPEHFEVRRVSGDHTIRWKSRKVFVSTVLVDHHVGLETIGDGLHSVFFGPLHLGWLDERDFRIMDVKDHTRRRR